MRKYLMLTMALGALIALTVAGIAAAEKPVKVRAGNLELTFNGGFSPKALSKTEADPDLARRLGRRQNGRRQSHPPALKEFIVETDKNGEVNVKGYPVCKSSQLQSQDSKHAKAICGSAILGEGKTDIEIKFPEQAPIPVHSPLILFNGGTKGGVTTFYVHAYITVPTPAAVVTTVKIKKVHNGRYGLKSVASVPPIVGGNGSVTHFDLHVSKKFTYKGKKISVLTAKCTDGKLQARGEAIFSDGTKAKAEVIRTCTPKG